MINTIIEAISIALNAEFGDACENRMEEPAQDPTGPCFFIQCLNSQSRLVRERKYFREQQFCIRYFPGSEENKNRECYETAERMKSCLEHIHVGGGLCRGTKMRWEITDGILGFFVNYNCFVHSAEESAPMESAMWRTKMKGGD